MNGVVYLFSYMFQLTIKLDHIKIHNSSYYLKCGHPKIKRCKCFGGKRVRMYLCRCVRVPVRVRMRIQEKDFPWSLIYLSSDLLSLVVYASVVSQAERMVVCAPSKCINYISLKTHMYDSLPQRGIHYIARATMQ